jgi:threonine dehydratase
MPDVDDGAREPVFADVEAAAERIRDRAVLTPLIENPALNEAVGGRVFIKAETLQRTGSFKFRGAYNKIRFLAAALPRPRCIVAFSSGNHAQGVAAAASLLGLPSVIVMPADAPAIKIANTKALGAEVRLYDRTREDREAVAGAAVEESGGVLVRPYDDTYVIAGQGTAGLEIVHQAEAAGAALDAVLVPCSGGGLAAGIAIAVKALSPATAVYTVEPADYDDTARSLREGRRVANETAPLSLCDALMAKSPGVLTFSINRRLVAGGLAVSDAEVSAAMEFAFRVLKLVVEPGGAVALAAVLHGKIPCKGRTLAVVCSGGNVDQAIFCRSLTLPR